MPKQEGKSERHQIRVDEYTDHVLRSLVGIKGKNHSEVAAFVFRQWISDHWEELASYGIKAQVHAGGFEK